MMQIWNLWELFDNQFCVHDTGFDLLDFDLMVHLMTWEAESMSWSKASMI